MEEFFLYDSHTAGSKGLVFIGDKILVYRRDENTKIFPLHLDLPGGGPETIETPFETFKREVMEEFKLVINLENIVYVRKYPSSTVKGKFGYFPVAKLSEEFVDKIQFGNEGIEYMLLSLDEYIARKDAWPVFQQRAKDYMNTLSS